MPSHGARETRLNLATRGRVSKSLISDARCFLSLGLPHDQEGIEAGAPLIPSPRKEFSACRVQWRGEGGAGPSMTALWRQ